MWSWFQGFCHSCVSDNYQFLVTSMIAVSMITSTTSCSVAISALRDLVARNPICFCLVARQLVSWMTKKRMTHEERLVDLARRENELHLAKTRRW